MIRASHRQPGFVAALLHRMSGIALAIFLPLHFLALGSALHDTQGLETFLAATNNPAVKFSEFAIVVALALHLALGLRVLAIEFLSLRDRTAATVSACLAAGLGFGLLFLLNVG